MLRPERWKILSMPLFSMSTSAENLVMPLAQADLQEFLEQKRAQAAALPVVTDGEGHFRTGLRRVGEVAAGGDHVFVAGLADRGHQGHFGIVIDVAEQLHLVVRHRFERGVEAEVDRSAR